MALIPVTGSEWSGDEVWDIFASGARGAVAVWGMSTGNGRGNDKSGVGDVHSHTAEVSHGKGGMDSDDIDIVFSPSSWGVASDSRAFCKRCGKVRALFFARLRIPAAALWLKKNLGGAWGSKISDNEHATATLGDSEKLAVEHTPCHPIPALDHENAEDFCKVSASVATEKSGNILDDKPAGSKLLQDSRSVVKESSPFTGKTGTLTGDGDILAGESSDDDIDGIEIMGADSSDIIKPFCVRKTLCENLQAKRFDFDLP